MPEQTAQPHDHLVGGPGIFQPRHAGDHVQGVEQKVRVHLAFQHFQPGVLQVLFQGQIAHLFPVQSLLGGEVLRHGVLHLVEGAGQTAHLILTAHGQVGPGKIVFRDAAGRLRQLQQGPHHGGRQHLQQHQHQRQGQCKQRQIQHRQALQPDRPVVVHGALLFQCCLGQPQGVFRQVVL